MKRMMCAWLAACVVFGSAGATFAGDALVATADSVSAAVAAVPSLDAVVFEGPAVEIGMDAVIEHHLTSGPAIELALINKRSDDAIARGYKDALDLLELAAPASLNAKLADMTRNFARANLETNHAAELNSIRRSAAELFLNTFRAQEYRRVAWDDLTAASLTLQNVQRKFQLGAASKLDVLTATNARLAAEKAHADARVGHAAALMHFNMEMGYPLLQDVKLIADLSVPDLPVVDLDAAIASALEKRNEVGGVKFAYEIQDVSFRNAKLTKHPQSTDYRKQEVAWLEAKYAADRIEDQMRADVLLKYMGLAQKHLAAIAAQNTVELSQEAYRISKISYGVGMNTLAELQKAEVAAGQARILAIGAITDLSLALLDFEFATDVGTYRVRL